MKKGTENTEYVNAYTAEENREVNAILDTTSTYVSDKGRRLQLRRQAMKDREAADREKRKKQKRRLKLFR